MKLNIKTLTLAALFIGTFATFNNSYAKCPDEEDLKKESQLKKGQEITSGGYNFNVESIQNPMPNQAPWRFLLSKEGHRRCIYHVLPAPSDNAFIAGKLVLRKERGK